MATRRSPGNKRSIYHNPNTLSPLCNDFFGDVVQYRFDNGMFHYSEVDFHPLLSLTYNQHGPVEAMPKVEETLRALGRKWVLNANQKRPSMEQKVVLIHNSWPGVR